MRIEEAFIKHLINNTGVKALIASRLYSFHAPVTAIMPYVTYQRVSTVRTLSHDQTKVGLTTPRIQFDIFSDKYADGLAIVDAMRNALQGFQGTMGGVGGLYVQSVLPALEQHIDLPDMDFYRITIDYMFSYVEE